MRKSMAILLALLLLVGFSGVAGATLYNRGNGMIYDSDQDLTWLQDMNYAYSSGYIANYCNYGYETWGMTWSDAMTWANQLVYGGFDDWRLPVAIDRMDISFVWDWGYKDFDGTTPQGYNITTSELGYMYYINLGNIAELDKYGNPTGYQPGTAGYGPFVDDMGGGVFWSGTENANHPGYVWVFDTTNGAQFIDPTGDNRALAWAVRDGDVSPPVPEPATMLLLASGLVGIGALRRRLRK